LSGENLTIITIQKLSGNIQDFPSIFYNLHFLYRNVTVIVPRLAVSLSSLSANWLSNHIKLA